MLLKEIFSCLILLYNRCRRLKTKFSFNNIDLFLSVCQLIDRQCHVQTMYIHHVIEQLLSSHETCSWLNLHMTIVHCRSLHILKNENQSLFIERIIALIKTIAFLPVWKTFRCMSIAFTSSTDGEISQRIRIHIDIWC